MADEKEFNIPHASMDSGKLSFENELDFDKSIQHGIFFLKFTTEISELIEAGDKFVQQFYENGDIQEIAAARVQKLKEMHERKEIGIDLSYATGYRDPEGNQVRQLAVAKEYWRELLINDEKVVDEKLVQLAEEMNKLAIDVLRNILRRLQIPEEDWNELTGGLTNNEGMHRILFNNYDSKKEGENGLAIHSDFGWITILRTNEPGLQVKIEEDKVGKWIKVNPIEDHFIVNFGDCLHDLTKKMETPVTACTHWVPKLDSNNHNGRKSFVVFTENRHDKNIYSLSSNGKEKTIVANAGQKIQERFHKLYSQGGKGVTKEFVVVNNSEPKTMEQSNMQAGNFLSYIPGSIPSAGKSGMFVEPRVLADTNPTQPQPNFENNQQTPTFSYAGSSSY